MKGGKETALAGVNAVREDANGQGSTWARAGVFARVPAPSDLLVHYLP